MIPDLGTLLRMSGKCHAPLYGSGLSSHWTICGPVHLCNRRAATTRRAESALSAGTDPRTFAAQDRIVVVARLAAPRQVSRGPPSVPRRGHRGQGREPASALVRAERPVVLSRVDAAAADARTADPDVHHIPQDGASDTPRWPRGQRCRLGRPPGRRRRVVAVPWDAGERTAQEGHVPRVLLLQVPQDCVPSQEQRQ
jgi:hypothetical protein